MLNNRMAVLGAGPVGLEAAFAAAQAGFEVTVLEAGNVAASVRQWGHVRLFTPFGMNASVQGRAAVRERLASETSHSEASHSGRLEAPLPADDAILTGHEFAGLYLERLARHPLLRGRIQTGTTVRGVARPGLLKSSLIGRADRTRVPFRVLTSSLDAGEQWLEADWVLDCSGTFRCPNPLGSGGLACPGETRVEPKLRRSLPDLREADRTEFAGKAVLLVGSGYSAATAAVELSRLAVSAPGTTTFWITRRTAAPFNSSDRSTSGSTLPAGVHRLGPVPVIAEDSLPERASLTAEANRIVTDPASGVRWLPGWSVRTLHGQDQRRLTVTLERATAGDDSAIETQVLEVDRILSLVGYRPDRSLYEELQVHECYASQGPMKLAAALLGAAPGADCLQQKSHGVDTLRCPEPRFFLLGAKSYGRDPRFLLKVGLEQVAALIPVLKSEAGL